MGMLLKDLSEVWT